MSLTLLDLRDARRAAAFERAQAKPQVPAAAVHNQEAQDQAQGFRRISGSTTRDLTPLRQDRMIEMAWWLYDANLFAKRLVGFLTDFVIGEGIRLRAEDERVQEVLDEFWDDPVNRMPLELPGYVRELSIFGEQLITAHVNRFNGRVRLGYIDPYEIEEVFWGSLSPDGSDIALPLEVKLKDRYGAQPLGSAQGKQKRRLKVINVVEDPGNGEMGFRAGDAFLFSVNKAKRGTRGRSDLFAAADYIDGYDQLLFSALERYDVSTRVYEDITLEGKTEEEIREWLNRPENRVPPKPLSKRAHNERVKYQILGPNLGAYELENAGARLFRNFVLGGMGFPNFWFGGGDETNLATAVEQGTPTFKMLAARQLYVRYMVADVAEFVIDRAILAGRLAEDVNRKIAVETPELSVRDASKISGALQQVEFSLASAVSQGRITEESAARIFIGMVNQLGFDVDADEELKILASRPRPEEIDYERVPPGKLDDAKNPAREEAREEA